MRKFIMLLSIFALLALAVVPGFAQDEEMGTIADVVVAAASGDEPEFTTLLAAVQAADPLVLEALADPEADFTVFAPTDAAFEALGEETISAVLADQELLTSILLYHVVEDGVDSEGVAEVLELFDGSFSVPTLQGQAIDVVGDDMGLTVDGANVVVTDIMASNGVIHVIDAVILPETRTIAEIVVEAASSDEPEFATLLAAVGAADPAVLEALSDPEAELTVFAPTDAAFEALGEETINAVLADQELLTGILLYHVLDGRNMFFDALDIFTEGPEAEVEMLDGSSATLFFDLETYGLSIDGANVVIADIDASNGVIHVIDAVILPAAE